MMTVKVKDKPKHLKNPEEIASLMQTILARGSKTDRNREHFWTISLDNGNNVLNIELISMGSSSNTVLEPMEVFSISLQKRATKLVLIHNHPSGIPFPSAADKDLTDRLIRRGQIMHIKVIDHIIIAPGDYFSFAEGGVMDELLESERYVSVYDVRERIENEKRAFADNRLLELAKAMKTGNYTIPQIVKLTGFSKQRVLEL